MKVSRVLIKLIKLTLGIVVVLGLLIPAVTFFYQKVMSGGRHVATEYFSLDYVSVKMEHFYAPSLSRTIVACISDYAKKNTLFSFDTKELYRQVKKSCSAIKDFDCHVRVPKSVDVHVVGVKPYCTVNKSYVLGDKRRLLPHAFFVDYTNNNTLPNITLNPRLCGDDKLAEPLFNFLHHIPQQMWQTFVITYHNPMHIELLPKEARCSCRIIVDEHSFFDEAKLKAVGNVFSDMVQKGFLSKKTLMAQDPHVTFDLRFDQRVVVKCKDAFNKRGAGL